MPETRESANSKNQPFQRISAGVAGLDELLSGGFLSGGAYLVLGSPGIGKTVLANQFCFHRVSKGGKAVYVTLLAENHDRMFGNLKSLRFFDQSQIGQTLHYINGFSVLEKEGFDALLKVLSESVRRHAADVLVIDGIRAAADAANEVLDFKKFVHRVNAITSFSGCTCLLLSSSSAGSESPEYTLVDGILELSFKQARMRTVREIEIRKLRGSSHLHGKHYFEILEEGLRVYPRIEAMYANERPPIVDFEHRLKTGVPGLDELMSGGVVEGSVTSVLGPGGTGKSNIGMNFLKVGAQNGEPALLFNQYEFAERLAKKLERMGQNEMWSLVKDQKIHVLRRPLGEPIPDKLFHYLLKELSEKKIKRLLIDGVGRIFGSLFATERLTELMIVFTQELRARGITTFFIEETEIPESKDIGQVSFNSGVTDNIIELKHAEIEERRTITVAVLKTRDAPLNPTLHEFLLTERGAMVGKPVRFKTDYLPLIERVDPK